MNVWSDRVVTQSLLTTTMDARRSWRSYLTSAVVHAAAIALMLAIFIPAAREIDKPRNTFVLLAPPLPSYRAAPPLPSPRVQARRPAITKQLPPIPAPKRVPPPALKPPEILQTRELPPNEVRTAVPVTPLPELKSAPAPKPEIHTGVFESNDLAKGPATPKQLKLGGFGDPNGVPASPTAQHSAVALAGVGSFDMPTGGGHGGAGGKGLSGVRQTSFDQLGGGGKGQGAGERSGSVQTGGFGDSAAIARNNRPESVKPTPPTTTPLEILFKPKPVYTAEARNLRLEGQVALEVTFLASGSIHVNRVLRGMGHGLDEAAQAAALQVRFRPATRGGVPVDTSATIYITFELA